MKHWDGFRRDRRASWKLELQNRQVSGLETSCSSKQILWLVPQPPSLRAKKGAAKDHGKTGMGMAVGQAQAGGAQG